MKFHWIINNARSDLNVIPNKYLYTTVNDYDIHPSAKSSCTFEKGRHFCVLRKPRLGAYTLLALVDENKNNDKWEENGEIGIFNGYPEEEYGHIFTENLGILIDMDKKKCVFYDYDRKTKKKIRYKKNEESFEDYEAPIIFKKTKIFVWIKRDGCNKGRKGITILNEGCIPIPDWVKD